MVYKRHFTRKQRKQRKQQKRRTRHSKKRHAVTRRTKKHSSQRRKKIYGGHYSSREEAIDELIIAIQEDNAEKVQEIMDDYSDITIEDTQVNEADISDEVRDVLSHWGFFERYHNE